MLEGDALQGFEEHDEDAAAEPDADLGHGERPRRFPPPARSPGSTRAGLGPIFTVEDIAVNVDVQEMLREALTDSSLTYPFGQVKTPLTTDPPQRVWPYTQVTIG